MMKATLTADAEMLHAPDRAASGLAAPVVRGRLADYLELTKPRIAVMALFTVGAGYLLGAGASADVKVLVHALVGAGLVAAGGSALTPLLARRLDARMRRTADRPLPSGRITPEEAASFGAGLSGAGLAYLLATVPAAAVVAALATVVIYVLVYTPLKQVTVWNTVVGAIPGALPPVIGWCAARGWGGMETAGLLFAVLFLWQLPHFMAIAWMYRDDYAAAGLRMLPGIDASGTRTATAMVLTATALLPIGALASFVVGGWLAGIGAMAVGAYFLWRSFGFERARTDREARRVLRASIIYLPCVFALILIDALVMK
jgi:protoheme IX farnesyltransferase